MAPGVFITEVESPAGGIPLAVKDLFDTAGVRTTYGSAIFRDHVPDRTAEAVARLEGAGYGFGAVAIEGCFPLAPSFDHAGPMARDVGGCERMMEALVAGFEAGEPPPLDDLAVGVAWMDRADPLVRARVRSAAALFAGAQPLELPFPDGTGPLFSREAATVHAELWARHRALYGDNVAHKIERALRVGDAEVEAAARGRERYRERIAELTASVDLVLTPTLGMVARRPAWATSRCASACWSGRTRGTWSALRRLRCPVGRRRTGCPRPCS